MNKQKVELWENNTYPRPHAKGYFNIYIFHPFLFFPCYNFYKRLALYFSVQVARRQPLFFALWWWGVSEISFFKRPVSFFAHLNISSYTNEVGCSFSRKSRYFFLDVWWSDIEVICCFEGFRVLKRIPFVVFT